MEVEGIGGSFPNTVLNPVLIDNPLVGDVIRARVVVGNNGIAWVNDHALTDLVSYLPPGGLPPSGFLVSPLTTKGDIWAWDTTDNRFPVGLDDQVLTVNSATSFGIEWQDRDAEPDRVGFVFGFTPNFSDNTFLGYLAGNMWAGVGDRNTIIGKSAASINVLSGNDNSILGWMAGRDLDNGNMNVLIGSSTGKTLINGNRNIFLGHGAGENTVGGNLEDAIYIGYQAGANVSFGGSLPDIGIGANTLQNHSGFPSIAIGNNAGINESTGGSSIIIGHEAGGGTITGFDNIMIGREAGAVLSSAEHNVIIGGQAGNTLTSPPNNVIIGYFAGQGNVTSEGNIIIGTFAAQHADIVTDFNIIIGYNAGDVVTSGDNILIGHSAGLVLDTGSTNMIIGNQSGDNLISGRTNTIVGNFSGRNLTTGGDNTFFGYNVGGGENVGSSNVIMGNSINLGGGGFSNVIALGVGITIGTSGEFYLASAGHPLATSATATGKLANPFSNPLQTNPIDFLNINLNGVARKIALYNP